MDMYVTSKPEIKLVVYLAALHSLRLHIKFPTSSVQIPQTTHRQNFLQSCQFQSVGVCLRRYILDFLIEK